MRKPGGWEKRWASLWRSWRLRVYLQDCKFLLASLCASTRQVCGVPATWALLRTYRKNSFTERF